MQKNKFQLKREATYAKLVASGLEVLCQKGYSTTTIDDIVGRAGYSKGAFYVHFKSKEDFMLELIRYRDAMRTDAGIGAPPAGGSTLEQAVAGMMDSLFEDLTCIPAWITVYIDFFQQLKGNEDIRRIYREFYSQWTGIIEGWIRSLQLAGLVPADTDSASAACEIYALIDGYLIHWNIYGVEPDRQRLTRSIVRLIR